MPVWVRVLIIAFGGAMLLEGAVYALFPDAMQRAMREMINMPAQSLRMGGLVVAAGGLLLIYLLLPKM